MPTSMNLVDGCSYMSIWVRFLKAPMVYFVIVLFSMMDLPGYTDVVEDELAAVDVQGCTAGRTEYGIVTSIPTHLLIGSLT